MDKLNGRIWDYLENSQKAGKLSHAYLFCGQEGTGKFELAIQWAKSVGKIELEEEKIIQGQHPDVFIIQPQVEVQKGKTKVKDISIEQVKNVVSELSLFAYQSAYKFLIINQANRMTLTAANSLLKIIEEPPQDTIIILITYNEDAILPTIRSRCQRIRFGLLSQTAIKEILQQEFPTVETETIEKAAELARGRIKIAEQYVENAEQLEKIQNNLENFRKTLRTGLNRGFELAEAVIKDKQQLNQDLEEWSWYLSRFQIKLIKEKSDSRVQKKTLEILKELLRLKELIQRTNANEKLQIENFFVKII